MYKIFDNQVKAVVGAHIKEYRNKWQTTTGESQLGIGSMATHFQLPPHEYHWATRQARDIAISANSLGTWFFSKEKLRGKMQRLLEIIPYRTEERGGGFLPVATLVL